MKRVLKEVEILRDQVEPHRIAALLLREASEVLGTVPETHGVLEAEWRDFQEAPGNPHLQAAARAYLQLSSEDRLRSLPKLTDIGNLRRYGVELIEAVPGRMIADLVGNVKSVRCSFASAAMPALQIALAARQGDRDTHVRFIDPGTELCDLVKLAASTIAAPLEVIVGQPLARNDGGNFEAEICMPPFGMDVRDRNELPRKTLERIDATERGRLHFEPVAMADMLVHAPHARVVFNFTAGALFRTVGFEAIARSEVVESGRIAAVFAVPQGMVFNATGIATSIVILDPKGSDIPQVRFIDLSDKLFGAKATRGQYDIRRESSWYRAVSDPLEGDPSWARDVPIKEIHDQNDILAVERYLRTQAAEALVAFLSGYETKILGDLVEIIRPVALPKSEDGDYTVHEASPADIGEAGFLGVPLRETRLAHGALRKARNQQVRPGDLLFSVKGTIAKVGIVGDDVPTQEDDGFWTAGQSLVILRTSGAIAPEVLYEYFSNAVVRAYVGSLAGGAAIQSISAKDLAALPIPLPAQDEQEKIVSRSHARHALFNEIERVRHEIDEHRAESWPHNFLKKAVGT